MRDLTPEQLQAASKAARSNVPYLGGMIVDSFSLLDIANAIDGEIAAMGNTPNQKITIHMDAQDAAEFSRAFRKMSLFR